MGGRRLRLRGGQLGAMLAGHARSPLPACPTVGMPGRRASHVASCHTHRPPLHPSLSHPVASRTTAWCGECGASQPAPSSLPPSPARRTLIPLPAPPPPLPRRRSRSLAPAWRAWPPLSWTRRWATAGWAAWPPASWTPSPPWTCLAGGTASGTATACSSRRSRTGCRWGARVCACLWVAPGGGKRVCQTDAGVGGAGRRR